MSGVGLWARCCWPAGKWLGGSACPLGEEWGDVLWALGVGLGEAHDLILRKKFNFSTSTITVVKFFFLMKYKIDFSFRTIKLVFLSSLKF